ncbi:uncharacterized protein TNCV_4200841 [Trichonephila clavipes]|uniref:Uncharacterized protein n=1 Tax=Trichonephila clavipes TaxID=2585209 RepID=A0A8X6WBF4_TRICX|nr:uncharacterized protein TNCV_4200841 [Trichonephila clavipes]
MEEQFDERMEEMSERVKDLEKKLLACGKTKNENKFVPASPVPITASPVSVKLYTYDGKTNWEVYKIQFGVFSESNRWTEGVKVCQLVASLREEAAEVLQTLTDTELLNLNSVYNALDLRFSLFLRENEIIGMMQQFKTGLSNSRVKRICKQGGEGLVTFDTVDGGEDWVSLSNDVTSGYIINWSVSDHSLNCQNRIENSLIEESIAVDRFDQLRAQNIVPRAINSTRVIGLPSLNQTMENHIEMHGRKYSPDAVVTTVNARKPGQE